MVRTACESSAKSHKCYKLHIHIELQAVHNNSWGGVKLVHRKAAVEMVGFPLPTAEKNLFPPMLPYSAANISFTLILLPRGFCLDGSDHLILHHCEVFQRNFNH